jgi:hypothetical protein
MNVAGIDISTINIDIVTLDIDNHHPPVWRRYELTGTDAWERTRNIPQALPPAHSTLWDDTLAIGIENPAGTHGAHTIQRAVGAVLACLPPNTLVQPWRPSEWRTHVGLKGNATKLEVAEHGIIVAQDLGADWTLRTHPQDCFDALCIALATRHAINTHTP